MEDMRQINAARESFGASPGDLGEIFVAGEGGVPFIELRHGLSRAAR
jgi:hypothetical protein